MKKKLLSIQTNFMEEIIEKRNEIIEENVQHKFEWIYLEKEEQKRLGASFNS